MDAAGCRRVGPHSRCDGKLILSRSRKVGLILVVTAVSAVVMHFVLGVRQWECTMMLPDPVDDDMRLPRSCSMSDPLWPFTSWVGSFAAAATPVAMSAVYLWVAARCDSIRSTTT